MVKDILDFLQAYYGAIAAMVAFGAGVAYIARLGTRVDALGGKIDALTKRMDRVLDVLWNQNERVTRIEGCLEERNKHDE